MFKLEGKKPSEKDTLKLSHLSHGAGCGCKISPAQLEAITASLQKKSSIPALLIGLETKDDAAAYDLGNGQVLISTADFFMPMVNDPFLFGKIAATNSLSDVYAMGAKPFLALAILGYPSEKMKAASVSEILAGAQAVCEQAGVVIAGGHTIDSPEPFFGLSVNGMLRKENLKRNCTAQNDDIIYITKSIGVGVLSTALKREIITDEEMKEASDEMCKLNSVGEKLGEKDYVTAMTDITGFGLLGHLIEVCDGSNLSAEIDYTKIPLLAKVKELAAQLVYADNTMRNWQSYESKVSGINSESLLTLCDPQTSGGLLFTVKKEYQTECETFLKEQNSFFVKIGRMKSAAEKTIYIS